MNQKSFDDKMAHAALLAKHAKMAAMTLPKTGACIVDQDTAIMDKPYIVPDNYDGEWGGVSVCEKCYLIMRGMQAERPGQIIARTEVIRVLFKTENRSDNKHD